MTKEEAVNKVVDFAMSQVGYHEVGTNLTKYAEESNMDELAYGFSMDGQPWCDFFVDYCFWKCFTFNIGQRMIYQFGRTGGAACMNSASFYRENGAWYGKPEKGDQVIYAGENHTGLVVAVYPNGLFDSVDGNYSDAVTLRKGLSPSCASGFGRPNWSLVSSGTEVTEEKEDTVTAVTENVTEAVTTDITEGSIVSLKAGATYYNGVNIPAKYFTKKWYVYQINGDRAVLNTSTDGSISGWMSPINVSNLIKGETENVYGTSSVSSPVNSGSTVTSNLWGIGQQLVEKVMGPVIINPTHTSTHTYGGKKQNLEE